VRVCADLSFVRLRKPTSENPDPSTGSGRAVGHPDFCCIENERLGWLGFGAVALFVFFARAAGAWIVAAYFFSGDAGGVAVAAGGGAYAAGLFEFALLFLLELALEGVDGGGGGAVVGDRRGLARGGGVGGGCGSAHGELLLGLLSLCDGGGVGLGVG
jgi:hypothetical protein